MRAEATRANRLPDIPALDGLRALSVIAVLIYHGGAGWLPGGFLGVEVFFVISGYLITALLLAEYTAEGSIDLKRFWLGRARRLLPAVFVVLIATSTFAVVFLPEEVAGLRADVGAALGYVTNWYLIFADQSYFEAMGRPSLLQHLWSLAIEEQFYLIWPVLLWAGLSLWGGVRERYKLFFAIAGLIAASTVVMALLYEPGQDPSRLYYGTDTRAAALLIGAALAFVCHPYQLHKDVSYRFANTTTSRHSGVRAVLAGARYEIARLGALTALVVLALTVSEQGAFLYRGGFALVSVVSAVLIATLVYPRGGPLQTLFSSPAVRWVGRRSYGIYLWHWPIFMVSRPGMDIGLTGAPAFAVRLMVTLVAADLCYRLVERPVRRGALGRAWRRMREESGDRRRTLQAGFGGGAAACVAVCSVLGLQMALAKEPQKPRALSQSSVQTADEIESTDSSKADSSKADGSKEAPTAADTADREGSRDGQDARDSRRSRAVDDRPAGEIQSHVSDDRPATRVPAEGSGSTAPERTDGGGGHPAPSRAPSGEEPASEGISSVTAVGDSVLVGAANSLDRRLSSAGMELGADASVGMQSTTAIGKLEALSSQGKLGEAVVIHIGNNGTVSGAQFERMMEATAEAEKVVVVTDKVPRSWEEPNNRVLRTGATDHPEAVLADWHAVSDGERGYFYSDGIHLTPEGQKAYSQLISSRITSE